MKTIKYLIPAVIAAMSITDAGATEGKMKGVDKSNFDETISPKDDFFQFACGGWMKANPLPAQYSRFGTFDILAENNKTQVKELIQNLANTSEAKEAGSIAQKVNDMYQLGMDSVRLNAEKASPLKADLEKITTAKRADFINIISWLHMGIGAPFFDTGVMSDLMDSNINIMYVSLAGLGLGDRDYYIENDENSLRIREAYKKYIETVFTLAGYKKSAVKTAVKNVMKIETALAKVTFTREESRDIAKQYNIRTIEQLKADYANIDWTAYFAGIGLPEVDKVCVDNLKGLAEVNSLMKTLTDKEIKDYFAFEYIMSASSSLSDDFIEANFEMFSKTLSGKKEMQPRWKRAIGVPNSLLGEAVGKLYVEKYFAGKSKEKMIELVNNLKISLAEHIASLEWMSDKTKVNALVKLNSFKVKIGYPDKWKDYSGVVVDKKLSYWENVKAANLFRAKDSYSKWGKPVDKEEWGMTPQTVNAYYNPTTNEICFPAGILQAPYFDVNADDACNYGAIGVVIGHEMTHGFDDQGRNFDQNGNMIDWWTEEDATKFKQLTDKLVEQFNEIVVADDVHANGRFTLGENIADHGGLRVAYTAFKKTPQGQNCEKIDGFTPDQRFYISYANVWKGNITKEEILRRTKTDPHSLGKWRVNASLRNIEPFFKAFDIKEGDAMYRIPADRVTIW